MAERAGFRDRLPPYHAYTVTVPGALAAWVDAHGRWGRLPMADILEAAIGLAERGHPVSPLTANWWGERAERVLIRHRHGGELMIDGRGPRPGEMMRLPNLARTLRILAEQGREPFYRGEIAERIVAAVGEDRLHLMIEAMRLAFADARRYIADAAFSSIPVAELLSEEYAERRGKGISMKRGSEAPLWGDPTSLGSANGDTVYFCVTDADGNACSFVNSNYLGFGTGIVPEGCGFSLQNRGYGFVLDSKHPNGLTPGKRPYHTIIPGLSTHAALDRGRFQLEEGLPEGDLLLEDSLDPATVGELENRGHRIKIFSGLRRSLFGLGQIILQDRHGVYWGGSGPLGDGCGLGLS